MMTSNLKPPLARSPIRLRSRRVLQPTANTIQTPPGYLMKTQKPILAKEEDIWMPQDYQTMSCDLRVLAKMVHQDLGKEEEMDYDDVSSFSAIDVSNANRSPLFERGRFYDEYARRRNERLRKKKGEKVEDKKPIYDLGVRTEVVKRRGGEGRKYESARKGVVPSTPVTQRKEPTTASRYLLRSSTSKENKKPSLSSSTSFSAGIGEKKKIGARRVGRI